MNTLEFKKLHSGARAPQRATPQSAGLDLYTCIPRSVVLRPGARHAFPTGIAVALPPGTVGLIYGRSGLGVKHSISPSNAVGVIDSDYRGELIVSLQNYSQQEYIVQPDDRIAQLVITPVYLPTPVEVLELDDTQRGADGFGSSGRGAL